MWKELSDGEYEPEPAGNAWAHGRWHLVVELFDVLAKELIACGQIELVLRQAVVTIETVAVEVVVVDREERPLHDQTHEARECDEIGRKPFRIDLDHLVPERVHHMSR